jgi:hypothetical protein
MEEFSSINTKVKTSLHAILLVMVAGCTPGNSPSNAVVGNEFKVVTVEKRFDSSSSPVGYWETSLTYPQLIQTGKTTLDSINKQIDALVERYSCQGSGEHTFAAAPIYGSGSVLSFYYEATWMCASMPSPDSVSGTVNYNLESGTSLSINEEFIDASAQRRFVDLANQLLEEKLRKLPKEEISGCKPFENASNALVSAQGIEMRSLSSVHGEPDCPVSVLVPETELGSFFKPNSVILK